MLGPRGGRSLGRNCDAGRKEPPLFRPRWGLPAGATICGFHVFSTLRPALHNGWPRAVLMARMSYVPTAGISFSHIPLSSIYIYKYVRVCYISYACVHNRLDYLLLYCFSSYRPLDFPLYFLTWTSCESNLSLLQCILSIFWILVNIFQR